MNSCDNEPLKEDTVKRGNSWVNKGKEGTHGKFKTKKEADNQRKAMFANGYKSESLEESAERTDDLDTGIKDETETIDLYDDFMKKDCFDETDKELIKGIRDDEKDHRRILRDMKAGKKNIHADESLGFSSFLTNDEIKKINEWVKYHLPSYASYAEFEEGEKLNNNTIKAYIRYFIPNSEDDYKTILFSISPEGKIDVIENESLKEEINLPAYSVNYITGYAGNGVNRTDTKYFRTEKEQKDFVDQLKSRNVIGIKTGKVDDFYHTEEESLQKPINTKNNIRESLNNIDWDTDNKYDLRNMYDSSIMTKEQKVQLAKMISLNESYEKMYNYLRKFI